MTNEFDAQIELLDGVKPPKTWCQVGDQKESWSLFPVHIDGPVYKVLFLVPDAPVKNFIGKRTELKQAQEVLGWITIS